ncbi:uncharacterized protein SRS1_16365 [Sporisorium reilianum f. sp. reilianum]|uniref:Uncharacterized protein n=1 Tax=Sporisorium reilianum f. sp. reilianum TaxID=72559 RepID=A0A2N8ULY8_9BASI|nr:uncharacterized protein SRS1_16365 [Sporisorium reilianum f. sp. reilianum]
MPTSMTSPRNIGLHERYAVARRCVDSPSIVSAAAILRLVPDSKALNVDAAFSALRAHLAHRIDLALAQFPLLGYCVDAPRSKAPRWAPIRPAPTSSDILHIGPAISEGEASTLLSRAILAEQSALPAATQLDKGPLWRVHVSQVGGSAKCVVVLSTDHVVNDGRGTLNLFQMLLRADPLEGTAQPIPPASDKIFNFKPSTGYMLGVVWQELILPKLPLGRKLKAKLRGPVSWPASPAASRATLDVARLPKTCPSTLDIMFVTAPHLISNLKALAQQHIDRTSRTQKAATLHSIIHTLALAALYAAIAQSHSIDAEALTRFELVLTACTPISLREEERASKRRRGETLARAVESAAVPLPATTGNYVSSYTHDFRVRGSGGFWRCANWFAAHLASPRGRTLAKQHMGLLAYIPDFDASHKRKRTDEDEVEKSLGGLGADAYANGWEKFFGDKAASPTAFDSALTVSNLGLIDINNVAIPADHAHWAVDTATWAQSHTPQGEAFGIDLVGYAADEAQTLSIALSGRPTAFADAQLLDRFRSFLQRLVVAFAEGTPGKLSQESQDARVQLDLSADPSFASLARFLISSS